MDKDLFKAFDKMKEIVLPTREMTPEEALLYYYCNGERQLAVQQEISLDEPIVFEAMQKALDRTMKRFPYFKVKVEIIDGRPCFVHNDKPFLLARDRNNPSLLPEDANDYLIRFSVDGNKLRMYNVHLLTDGRGKLPLVQTLLTHYYHLIGVENTSAVESRYLTIPDDIAKEWESPYSKLPADIPHVEFFRSKTPCFHPNIERDARGRAFVYCIEIPSDKMMAYAKSVGGTPNTVLSAIFAHAIKQCNPDCYNNGQEVKIGVIVDTKPSLGTPISSINAFSAATMCFNENRDGLSADELQSQLRADLKAQTTPEYMQILSYNSKLAGQFLFTLPTSAARRASADSYMTGLSSGVTAGLSYAGQSKLGDISSHVEHVRAIVEACLFDMLIEVNCTDTKFCVALIQSFEDRRYIEAMKEILDNLGVGYYDRSTMTTERIPFRLASWK